MKKIMKNWLLVVLLLVFIALLLGWIMRRQLMPVITPLLITARVWQYGAASRDNLQPLCRQAGMRYPPDEVILLALKREREMQLYGRNKDEDFRYLGSYAILAASDEEGPKLHEGDMQVPEGFYRIESLHPLSSFHLALRVNYPNKFDRAMALDDGRANLGGDIMIHGSNSSAGCLAMGNRNIRDLYVLAYDCGLDNVSLIISPCDFRENKIQSLSSRQPRWLSGLYGRIADALVQLPDK